MKRILSLLLCLLMAALPVISHADSADLDAAYVQARALFDAEDYAGALPLLEEQAALGSARAMNLLGVGYWYGHFTGGMRDRATALDWYTRAIDAGSVNAMYNLGLHAWQGSLSEDGAPDYPRALELLTMAAEAGSAPAMNILGDGCREGHFTADGQADYAAALDWYTRGAELGDTYCMHDLAEGWHNGWWAGGTPDYARAHEWFVRADEGGHPCAAYHLAKGCADGLWSGSPDYAKAAEWYARGVELEHTASANALTRLCVAGKTAGDGTVLFERDYATAAFAARKACELETTDSYVLEWLGWFSAGNGGVMEADYEQALEVYTKAAELGSGYAMTRISALYLDGRLGEQDVEAAREWLRSAVEAGYEAAQAQLDALAAE